MQFEERCAEGLSNSILLAKFEALEKALYAAKGPRCRLAEIAQPERRGLVAKPLEKAIRHLNAGQTAAVGQCWADSSRCSWRLGECMRGSSLQRSLLASKGSWTAATLSLRPLFAPRAQRAKAHAEVRSVGAFRRDSEKKAWHTNEK